MSPAAVVEHLDVIDDILPCIFRSLVSSKTYLPGFQVVEEMLHHSIAPAISFDASASKGMAYQVPAAPDPRSSGYYKLVTDHPRESLPPVLPSGSQNPKSIRMDE